MQFDIFHSIGRIDNLTPQLSDRQVFEHFFSQVQAAEQFGYDTVWVAESHFSSEVQKAHKNPVIPNYQGEVGLNSDSMQLANVIFQKTRTINFGTAIHNIVGGNGGPIASADRVRLLAFLNALQDQPRKLNIGIAQGRFPYINNPFGIMPRNEEEQILWSHYKRIIFLEALEIFLRLSLDQTVSSDDLCTHFITREFFKNDDDWQSTCKKLALDRATPKILYKRRWCFESLKLVPELNPKGQHHLNFVLGSHDPLAQQLACEITDIDIFNLSFTPAEQINKVHSEMSRHCKQHNRKAWQRHRMPRTVLIFIDKDYDKAHHRASLCFDTYIEAMRGTVGTPSKENLMSFALMGTPQMIIEQLSPDGSRGFQQDDRLMLWFEFNQTDNDQIIRQMQLFAEKVMPEYGS